MTSSHRVRVLAGVLFISFGVAGFEGCSGSDSAGGPAPGSDAGATGDGSVASDSSPGNDANADAGGSGHVVFRYKPEWAGVTSVAVLGGFGQATDWSTTQPFLTLTDDGSGTFTGGADLPAGSYLYIFKVIGDSAASMPSTYARYAVDPSVSAFDACPMQSPTFSKTDSNPCSKLAVPQASATATFHVRGVVKLDAQPASGWLVELEREEASSHHFFAQRVTTMNDGTFDLVASAGQYRLQVLHPTYLTANDAARDPVALQALRRAISSSFPLAGDVAVEGPEVGFHEYTAFAPRDAGVLPTHFTFAADGGAAERLTVYGGTSGEIGDPWFASAPVTNGGADFDGGFNTTKAQDPEVKLGDRYFWGVERGTRLDGGVTWTAQTMVFPITWH